PEPAEVSPAGAGSCNMPSPSASAAAAAAMRRQGAGGRGNEPPEHKATGNNQKLSCHFCLRNSVSMTVKGKRRARVPALKKFYDFFIFFANSGFIPESSGRYLAELWLGR